MLAMYMRGQYLFKAAVSLMALQEMPFYFGLLSIIACLGNKRAWIKKFYPLRCTNIDVKSIFCMKHLGTRPCISIMWKRGVLYVTPLFLQFLIRGIAVTLTILLLDVEVFAQGEREFINKYNEHIDPLHRLDTIDFLSFNAKVDAEGVINKTLVKSNDTQLHKYFSNGTREVVDVKKNMIIDDHFYQPVEFNNAIKLYLGFISPDEESVTFKFLSVNDSTTILEKQRINKEKYIYIFDTKTKDLLQTEKINPNTNQHSKTTYHSYQMVNGILVPKDTSVSGSILQGTMKYYNVVFQSTPKDK
jgi:hypothetical protein